MCAARRGGSLVAVCLGGKKRTLTFHSGVCGLRGLRQFYEKLLVHPSDTVNNINNAVNNTVNNINTLTFFTNSAKFIRFTDIGPLHPKSNAYQGRAHTSSLCTTQRPNP